MDKSESGSLAFFDFGVLEVAASFDFRLFEVAAGVVGFAGLAAGVVGFTAWATGVVGLTGLAATGGAGAFLGLDAEAAIAAEAYR